MAAAGGVGSGGQGAGRAAAVWAAAGTAYARAAAARQCAVIDACWHAWKAKVDAGRAMGRVAAANGRVVRYGNRADRAAVAEATSEMHRTVDALERAAVEFRQAAKLSDAAADGWARAAAALARAGMAERERAARELSGEARKLTHTVEVWADMTGAEAARLGREAGQWVEYTADWEDGCGLAGSRDEWMKRRDKMQTAADREREMAEEMEQRTAEAAETAAGDLRRAAAEAERYAAAARGDLASPDAQEAAAALRDGTDEARRADRDR